MPSLEQIRRQRRLDAEKANAGQGNAAVDDNAAQTIEEVSESHAAQEQDYAVAYDAREDGGGSGIGVRDAEEPVEEPVQSEETGTTAESVGTGGEVLEYADIPASGKELEVSGSDDMPHGERVIDDGTDTVDTEAGVEQGGVPEEVGGAVLEKVPELERVPESLSEPDKSKKKPSGGKSQRSRSKRGRKPVADDFKEDGTIRVDLPSKLVAMARTQFPDAGNNTEAVAAWIYAKSDKTMDVPDSVKRLAATYTGDQMSNLVKDVSERLAVLDSRTMKMQMLTDGRVQEMWYMVAYLMLERMDALAKTHMKDLDLSLPVFETLRSEVNSQFRKVRNRQQLADGRQVYQRKVQGKRTDVKD